MTSFNEIMLPRTIGTRLDMSSAPDGSDEEKPTQSTPTQDFPSIADPPPSPPSSASVTSTIETSGDLV